MCKNPFPNPRPMSLSDVIYEQPPKKLPTLDIFSPKNKFVKYNTYYDAKSYTLTLNLS